MYRVLPRVTSNNRFLYLGLSLAMLSLLKGQSQWEMPVFLDKLLFYFGALFLLIQSGKVINKYKPKELLFVVCFLLVCIISGIEAHDAHVMVITGLSVMAAKGEKIEEIARCYFCFGVGFLLFNVIGSSVGIVPNVVADAHKMDAVGELTDVGLTTGEDRMCFGYGWPTNFANHLFFIMLAFWMFAIHSFPIWSMIALFLSTGFFVYFYTDTRLSALCVFALAFVTLAIRLVPLYKVLKVKLIRWLLILFVPIVTYISYYLSWKYDETSPSWFVANLLLTNRLSLGHDALVDPGVSILGQEFEMYSGVDCPLDLYNYVDNSFLQALIIYGLIFTVLMCMLFMKVTTKAIKNNNLPIIFGVLLVTASGFVSQHTIQIFMNFLFLAYSAKFSYIKPQKKQKKKKVRGRKLEKNNSAKIPVCLDENAQELSMSPHVIRNSDMTKKPIVIACFFLFSLVALANNADSVSIYIDNPVIKDIVTHDMSFVRDDDGYFYAFGTSNKVRGNKFPMTFYGINIFRSRDLQTWEFYRRSDCNRITDVPAELARDYNNGCFFMYDDGQLNSYQIWAPEIFRKGDKYVLFVALVREKKYYRIAAFETDDLTKDFEFKRIVVSNIPADKDACVESTGIIDPCLIRDNGRLYMLYGSFARDGKGVLMPHRKGIGVYLVEIDDETYERKSEPVFITDYYEGCVIVRRKGKYYLFGTNGFFTDNTYKINYAVADKIEGPYQNPEGKLINDTINVNLGQVILQTPNKENRFNGFGCMSTPVIDNEGRYWVICCGHDLSLPPIMQRTSQLERYTFLLELKWDADDRPYFDFEEILNNRIVKPVFDN